jgi:hypothetical protein
LPLPMLPLPTLLPCWAHTGLAAACRA